MALMSIKKILVFSSENKLSARLPTKSRVPNYWKAILYVNE
jgi:hypothetical protein